MERTARRAAFVPLIALCVGLLGAAPAAARPQEPVKISKEIGEVKRDYFGMAGTSTVFIWPPEDCAVPGVTYCDDIPLDIVQPKLEDPSDEWIIEIEITWEDPETDIDLYLFDDGQATGSPEEINSSAGGTAPEKVYMYMPELDRVHVVPHLFSGVNLEYTLIVRYKELDFESPFEALAPEFGGSPNAGGGFDDAGAWSPAPIDYSAVPDGSGPVAGPQFGEIAIETDDDFEDFGESDFDREIAAPAIPAGTRRSLAPPADVPGIVALFWLLIVPAVLLGLGAFLIRRRSQAAMAFG